MKSPVFSFGVGAGGFARRFDNVGDILVSWASGDGNALGSETEVELLISWLLAAITS